MKKLIVSLLTLSFVIGCSKDNGGNELPTQETLVLPKKVVETYKFEGSENGVTSIFDGRSEVLYEVVDNKILSAKSTFFKNNVQVESTQFSITYDGDFPKSSKEINLDDNEIIRETTYEYTDGKLVKKVEKKSSSTYTESYKYDGNNLIETTGILDRSDSKKTETKKYTYVSASEIQEMKTTTYDDVNEGVYSSIDIITYTLDDQKRVIKNTKKRGSITETSEYQYDDKNNYKYNATGMLMYPDYFLDAEAMKNNLTYVKRSYVNVAPPNSNYTKETTYEYQYNDKGYPIRIEETVKENGVVDDLGKSTTEITY